MTKSMPVSVPNTRMACALVIFTRACVTMSIAIGFGVYLGGATEAAAEDNFQRLNGPQIRAKLVGMEFTDESHWGEIYEPNGTLRAYEMDRKISGKWFIHNDQLCVDRGDRTANGCYDVWLSGNQVRLKFAGADSSIEGKLKRPSKPQ
jgi:hypothetical protein